MYIDTASIESMRADIASISDISESKLMDCICLAGKKAKKDGIFVDEIFNDEILSKLYTVNFQNNIDEILVYHLSRRLIDSNDSGTSTNLYDLLTGDSSLSRFLRKHHITFESKENHIAVIYCGKEILLDDNEMLYSDYRKSNRLRKRLGYNGRQDFCFNGFLFRDSLKNTTYSTVLRRGPEVLQDIIAYLKSTGYLKDQDENIEQEYIEKSEFYCYTYRMPLTDILIDREEGLQGDAKRRYLLCSMCYHLYQNQRMPWAVTSDSSNLILRLPDNVNVPGCHLLKKEKI